MFDMFNYFAQGGFARSRSEYQKQKENGEVLRSEVGNYTIDSCYTFDCGYETAIWYEPNHIVIVEYYDSKEDMATGHKKWCEFCKNNPKEVYSVSDDEMKNLI